MRLLLLTMARPGYTGEVKQVKVLGGLAMIDVCCPLYVEIFEKSAVS